MLWRLRRCTISLVSPGLNEELMYTHMCRYSYIAHLAERIEYLPKTDSRSNPQ